MLKEFVTINEVLNGVDLVISDYSSLYIDYINLERPVLFLDTDKEEFERNRGIIFETLDFWWLPGPRVHSIDKFVEETLKLLNNDQYYQIERQKFNKIVNSNTEPSNKELIDFILNVKKSNTEQLEFNVPLLEKSYNILKTENKDLIQENKKLQNENLMLGNNNEKLLNSNKELADGNKWIREEYEKIKQEYEKIIYSRSYKYIKKIKKFFKRAE